MGEEWTCCNQSSASCWVSPGEFQNKFRRAKFPQPESNLGRIGAGAVLIPTLRIELVIYQPSRCLVSGQSCFASGHGSAGGGVGRSQGTSQWSKWILLRADERCKWSNGRAKCAEVERKTSQGRTKWSAGRAKRPQGKAQRSQERSQCAEVSRKRSHGCTQRPDGHAKCSHGQTKRSKAGNRRIIFSRRCGWLPPAFPCCRCRTRCRARSTHTRACAGRAIE